MISRSHLQQRSVADYCYLSEIFVTQKETKMRLRSFLLIVLLLWAAPVLALNVRPGDSVKLIERDIGIPAHPEAGDNRVNRSCASIRRPNGFRCRARIKEPAGSRKDTSQALNNPEAAVCQIITGKNQMNFDTIKHFSAATFRNFLARLFAPRFRTSNVQRRTSKEAYCLFII